MIISRKLYTEGAQGRGLEWDGTRGSNVRSKSLSKVELE